MTTLDSHYRLDDFAPATWPAWRATAAKLLGHDPETAATRVDGIEVPILRADDDRPVAPPMPMTARWSIVECLDAVVAEAVPSALHDAAAQGASHAWRTLPAPMRAGAVDPAIDPAWLRTAAESEIGLCIDAGAAARWVDDACVRAGVEPAAVMWDPLSSLAELGVRRASLAVAYERIAAATERVVGRGSKAATLLASGVPFHDAGFGPVVELGMTIGIALAHLRGLEAHAISGPQAAEHLCLRLSIGPDVFVEIAKLRAARRLWTAVLRRIGADAARTSIVAQTSWHRFARMDAPVNLLRHTTQAFAAVVGGADRIEIRPHVVPADAAARRWARNIHHLLAGEAWLGAVADPAAGSASIEHLTESLAAAAWPIAVRMADDDPEAALRSMLRDGFGVTSEPAPVQVGVDLFPPGAVALVGDDDPPDPTLVIPDAAATVPALPLARRARVFEAAAATGGAR